MRLFWNDAEGRIRAPWRLLVHATIFLLSTSLFAGIFSMPLTFAGDTEAHFTITEEGSAISAGLLLAGTLGALGGALISTWFAAVYLDRRPFRDLGLRITPAWWADFVFGLLLGVALIAASFAVKVGMGWVQIVGWGLAEVGPAIFLAEFVMITVAFVAVGFWEELVVRGYQMTNLAEALNMRRRTATGAVIAALVLTSLGFAVLHTTNPGHSTLGLVNIGLISLMVLGLAYAITGRLGLSIGLHVSWNFALSFIFGLPVSGVVVGSAPLLIAEDIGPELWTGGPFGQEGGLLGTLAIVTGCIAVIAWLRFRERGLALSTDLAKPPDAPSPS